MTKSAFAIIVITATLFGSPVPLLMGQGVPVPRELETARRSVQAVVDGARAPSVAVAVARNQRLIWNEAFGYADRERRRLATTDTPYSIASVTKPMTATAVMLLSDRGKLSLSDSVTKYAPAIQRPGVRNPDEVTIRRVLGHVGGFPVHYQFFYEDQADRPAPPAATMRCFGAEVSPPGRRYVYSNLGFEALRAVIEQVSGEPFADFLSRELFRPLEMRRTSVVEEPDAAGEAAVRYGTDGKPLPFYWTDHSAASAVYSTAADLVRFGRLHAGDPPAGELLTQESIGAMREPGLGSYGLGWSVNPNWHGRLVLFHSGAMPGASATLWVVPAERIVIALTANQIGVPVNRIAGEILELLLAATGETPPLRAGDEAPGGEPAPPAEEVHGRWEGTWSTCLEPEPIAVEVSTGDEVLVTIGDGHPLRVESAGVSGGRLTGELQTSPRVEYRFDLTAGGGRLRGPVVRRTSLGPRGNTVVTLWADLVRRRDSRPPAP